MSYEQSLEALSTAPIPHTRKTALHIPKHALCRGKVIENGQVAAMELKPWISGGICKTSVLFCGLVALLCGVGRGYEMGWADNVCICPGGPRPCHIDAKLVMDQDAYPAGDRFVASCVLTGNPPCQFSSKQLYMEVSDHNISGVLINSTTVNFTLRADTAIDGNSSVVTCYMRGYHQRSDKPTPGIVAQKTVYAGGPPDKPHSISCIVNNLESMNCTWEPTEQINNLTVTQSLYYKKHSFYLSEKVAINTRCQHQVGNVCYWRYNLATNIDAQVFTHGYVYGIQVVAENALERVASDVVIIDSDYIVKLRKVKDMRVTEAGRSSVLLTWRQPVDDYYRQRITYHIKVESQWGRTELINITRNQSVVYYNVTGLVPHTYYVISVRCITPEVHRMAWAEDFWSEEATIEISTMSDVPGAAPLVTPGGYMRHSNKQVELFWQPVPPMHQNGWVHHTRIQYFHRRRATDPSSCSGFPETLTVGADVYSVVLPSSEEYWYDVCVDILNHMGYNMSLALLPIRIPPSVAVLPKPKFYAMATGQNVSVTVMEHNATVSHTMFWCIGYKYNCDQQPYQWRHLNTSEATITELKQINHETAVIAMSVEYMDGEGIIISSGMEMAPYIFYADREIQAPKRLQTFDRQLDSQDLVLQWTKPRWTDTAYISHFKLKYCERSKCAETELSREIAIEGHLDGTTQTYTMSGLKLDTYYNFKIQSIGDGVASALVPEPVIGKITSKGLRRTHIIIVTFCVLLLLLLLIGGIYTIIRYCKKKWEEYATPFDVVVPDFIERYLKEETKPMPNDNLYVDLDQGHSKVIYWSHKADRMDATALEAGEMEIYDAICAKENPAAEPMLEEGILSDPGNIPHDTESSNQQPLLPNDVSTDQAEA